MSPAQTRKVCKSNREFCEPANQPCELGTVTASGAMTGHLFWSNRLGNKLGRGASNLGACSLRGTFGKKSML